MASDSNPKTILTTLDNHLKNSIELTLYGRSAIHLGFNAPSEYGATMDIDAIIPSSDVLDLEKNEDFWIAQDLTNRQLDGSGLYFTHIFEDKHIILTPNWRDNRVQLPGSSYKKLKLFRPSTKDLILTKMMREDPEDHKDIRFLLDTEPMTKGELEDLFAIAQCPPIAEIETIFNSNKKHVLSWAID